MIITLTHQSEHALIQTATAQLGGMTRTELRKQAQALNVQRGRNKSDTINNLIAAGHVRLLIETTTTPQCSPN